MIAKMLITYKDSVLSILVCIFKIIWTPPEAQITYYNLNSGEKNVITGYIALLWILYYRYCFGHSKILPATVSLLLFLLPACSGQLTFTT